ncbi:MAG: vWA domain-containing protein [Deltaproteobacteria bacterium]|nr:vWA domain-containing protein [Deltaproteobacteria bacterium]
MNYSVRLERGVRQRGLAVAGALGLVVSAGCGAKTGLLVPIFPSDATVVDADAMDAVDVPDVQDVTSEPEVQVCVPGRFPLDPRGAEVMIVVDRSNSMAFSLDGNTMPVGEPSRWQVLRDALDRILPAYQRTVSFGAKFYPQPITPGNPDLDANCRSLAGIDLAPALNNAGPLVRFFDTTRPGGGTPTFDGLQQTAQYLRSRPGRGSARYIVLATDGGPNCNRNNPSPAQSCVCTSSDPMACRADPRIGIYNCLDDARTVALVQDVAMPTDPSVSAIPVFVVGLDGSMTTRQDLLAVLDRMAVAGGRPRTDPMGRRYYSVREPADLQRAFDTIVGSISQCSFVTPSRPDDPNAIDVEINGVVVPRDVTRTQGWDWTDQGFGELTFFGSTCASASQPGARVNARVGCRDR